MNNASHTVQCVQNKQNCVALVRQSFDLDVFLQKVDSNLQSSVLNLVAERTCVSACLWLYSKDAYKAWQALFHNYIQHVWPETCSLCCAARKEEYCFRMSVDNAFAEHSAPVRAAGSASLGGSPAADSAGRTVAL